MTPVRGRRRACLLRSMLPMLLACAATAFVPAGVMARTGPSAAADAPSYVAIVAEAARRFGLSEASIWAVMRAESGGNPRAISAAGAMGLMQLMPATWRSLTARYGLAADPFDVHANILAGAAYLREMLDRYGDLPTALAAYNAGPGRVDQWRSGTKTLPAETLSYDARITPSLGASDTASRAASTVRALPIAPTWRTSVIFVARNDRTSVSAAPSFGAQPGSGETAPPSSARTPSIPSAGSLFIPLSGRSEQ